MTNLTNEQKVLLAVAPVTASGKPAKIDGQPLWSSSDVNVLTLEVAADGLSATAFGVNAGVATVKVVADSDLSAGVVEISATADFVVSLAPAANLVLTVGVPA